MYLKRRDHLGNTRCMRCGGTLDAQLRCAWQGCSNSLHGVGTARMRANAERVLESVGRAFQNIETIGEELERAVQQAIARAIPGPELLGGESGELAGSAP